MGADMKAYHSEAVKRLQAEYDQLKQKLDTMYDDKLSGLITAEMFQDKAAEFRRRMEELFSAIVEHESVDPTELDRSVEILELVRNARSMYLKRSGEEKRRLVRNLLSNCSWKNGTLQAEFRKPYDKLVDTNLIYEQKKAAGASPSSLLPIWYAVQDLNRFGDQEVNDN
jgi:site-specific DNA recombinase